MSKKTIDNPAITLFGRRVFADQNSLEFLHEFLLVANSPKRQERGVPFTSYLPPFEELSAANSLEYAPKARLNLKLFSFIGASKLSSRARAHRQHLESLRRILCENISTEADIAPECALDSVRDLFLGLQGSGKGRIWSAQNFFPLSSNFLATETLWKTTKAIQGHSWRQSFERVSNHWNLTPHIFLARGGELFYLQICQALQHSKADVDKWLSESGVVLRQEEKNPQLLHTKLECVLGSILEHSALDELSSFVESAEQNTAQATDTDKDDEMRFVSTGSCPEESWTIGYLLAVEIVRVGSLKIDKVERITQLQTLLSLHILRHLCFLSAKRNASVDHGYRLVKSWLEYALIVMSQSCDVPRLRKISQANLKNIQQLMHDAVHSFPNTDNDNDFFKEADKSYGFAVFRKIGKNMGFIIPRKGQGERMVLTENILRTLVLMLVPAGKELTYDTFKKRVQLHFGIVFDNDSVSESFSQIGFDCDNLGYNIDQWVMTMLEQAGMLVQLSDSCALVRNTVLNK